jgi:hypothetical protein
MRGGSLECYCGNPSCDAREVEITFKAFTTDEPPARALCLLCGREMNIHGILTFDQWVKRERASCL